MKSVLIVRLDADSYSSDGICKAFRNNFEVVEEFSWQKVLWNLRDADDSIGEFRRRLIGKTLAVRPDFIWLHIQREGILDVNTCQALSEISYTCLYTFDVRKEIWQKDIAPFVDLVLFGDMQSIQEMKEAGFDNVGYLQSAADYDLYKPTGVRHESYPYGEIVFIGNNYLGTNLEFENSQQRVDMVEFMQKEFGDRFKVYGLGWKNSRMLNPKEEIEAYSTCRVAICHNNFTRNGYASDRQFRAMGCGASTIMHYYPLILFDFRPASNLLWDDFERLGQICITLLKEDNRAIDIGNIQRIEVLSRHTWDIRIKSLLSLIKKNPKNARTVNNSY